MGRCGWPLQPLRWWLRCKRPGPAMAPSTRALRRVCVCRAARGGVRAWGRGRARRAHRAGRPRAGARSSGWGQRQLAVQHPAQCVGSAHRPPSSHAARVVPAARSSIATSCIASLLAAATSSHQLLLLACSPKATAAPEWPRPPPPPPSRPLALRSPAGSTTGAALAAQSTATQRAAPTSRSHGRSRGAARCGTRSASEWRWWGEQAARGVVLGRWRRLGGLRAARARPKAPHWARALGHWGNGAPGQAGQACRCCCCAARAAPQSVCRTTAAWAGGWRPAMAQARTFGCPIGETRAVLGRCHGQRACMAVGARGTASTALPIAKPAPRA